MSCQRSRTPESPYCWQSKDARRTICEHFDGDNFGAACLGVYAAMTEIASDEEVESFTTLQSHIAKKACLGLTTVRKALKALRELGVIFYETPRLRGPIQFTLLATRRTLTATRRTFVKSRNRRPLTTVEEHIEEQVEETIEEPPRKPPEEAGSPSEAVASEAAATSSTAIAPEAATSSKPSPARKLKANSNLAVPSEIGLKFADWFRGKLPDNLRLAAAWRDKWARCYDDMLRLDKRSGDSIKRVCEWARNDAFWGSKFLSPLKLRSRDRHGVNYFDVFTAQMNGEKPKHKKNPPI